jgi:uncharacterized protein (TIGR03435 family)
MTHRAGNETDTLWKFLLALAGAMVLAVPLVVCALTANRLQAQEHADQPPSAGNSSSLTFETASINPTISKGGFHVLDMGLPEGLEIHPGGQVTGEDIPLRLLIGIAYRLSPAQIRLISGLPPSIDSMRFDLEALPEQNPSQSQIASMMQALLADRFKLSAHHETREVRIYDLVAAKPGKLGPQVRIHTGDSQCSNPDIPAERETPDSVFPIPPCGSIRFLATGAVVGAAGTLSMERFAANLGGQVDRPVVDRTGLNGNFDLTLDYNPDLSQPDLTVVVSANPPYPPPAPSIFVALQQQLRLKLVPDKGPVDILVIDHVEQPSAK